METNIPGRFPVEVGDVAVHALSRYISPVIHLCADLPGELDADRLARAFFLCLTAHPILACRFVPRWAFPYWERLPDPSPDSVFSVDFSPDAERRFLARPLDATQGPQFSVLLTRGPAGHRLIVKAGHVCMDAGATKELAALAAGIYARLGREPGYQPEPTHGRRDVFLATGPLGARKFLSIAARGWEEQKMNSRPFRTLQMPRLPDETGPTTFTVRRLDHLGEVAAWARSRGSTKNDLLVTALLRSLARVTGHKHGRALRLTCTADLRRYLPGRRGPAPANLSGGFIPCFGMDPGPDFASLLSRVTRVMEDFKAHWLGLPAMFLLVAVLHPLPMAAKVGLVRSFLTAATLWGNAAPAFTNMGPIREEDLSFDGLTPEDAWLMTPPLLDPQFVMGMSGYRGSLHLSCGHPAGDAWTSRVNGLFEGVERELGSAGME